MNNRTLVVMTNGDTYYIDKEYVEDLRSAIEGKFYKTYLVTDFKSGAKLVLILDNISAIVEERSRG